MKHLIHKFMLGAIGVVIIISLWGIGDLLWPYNPLVFKEQYFPVKSNVLKQGSDLEFLVRYCKNMQVPAVVHYQFENSVIFFSTTVNHANSQKGCGEHWNIFNIPEELPPGIYRLVMTVDYKVSLIRTVSVRGATEQFTIISKDE